MKRVSLIALAAVLLATPAFAQITEQVYSAGYATINLSNGTTTFSNDAPPTARVGFKAYDTSWTVLSPLRYGVHSNANPTIQNGVFGDQLHLSSAGTLADFGWNVLNSNQGGNTGDLNAIQWDLEFYADPGVGPLGAPIAVIDTGVVDFTNGGTQAGLPVGYFSRINFGPKSLLQFNINLPQNIVYHQVITGLDGPTTKIGIVNDPTQLVAGASSLITEFVDSTGGLVNATTPVYGAPGQYQVKTVAGLDRTSTDILLFVDVVPEPATMALLGMGVVALIRRRR